MFRKEQRERKKMRKFTAMQEIKHEKLRNSHKDFPVKSNTNANSVHKRTIQM